MFDVHPWTTPISFVLLVLGSKGLNHGFGNPTDLLPVFHRFCKLYFVLG
jgi:hypothetical protein